MGPPDPEKGQIGTPDESLQRPPVCFLFLFTLIVGELH